MSHRIRIAPRKDFESKELWEMYKLRARIFKDRMGWDIPILSGMEIDGYDALDPYYMMIRDQENSLKGCWRALPTEGPYMLKDTFPELLHGAEAPSHPKVWELSRFAIEADGPQGFGFSGLSLDALREIVTFGDSMGIEGRSSSRSQMIFLPSSKRRSTNWSIYLFRYDLENQKQSYSSHGNGNSAGGLQLVM